MIYSTHLGRIVLDAIGSAPTHLTITYNLIFNEYLPYNIKFAGPYNPLLFPAFAWQNQNYYETVLGHELWHAFQSISLGHDAYMLLAKSSEGSELLQNGAIAFENYLASVLHGEDWVRSGGVKGAGMDYYNRLGERLTVGMTTTDKISGLSYPTGYQNNISLTPDVQTYYNNLANIWLKL